MICVLLSPFAISLSFYSIQLLCVYFSCQKADTNLICSWLGVNLFKLFIVFYLCFRSGQASSNHCDHGCRHVRVRAASRHVLSLRAIAYGLRAPPGVSRLRGAPRGAHLSTRLSRRAPPLPAVTFSVPCDHGGATLAPLHRGTHVGLTVH